MALVAQALERTQGLKSSSTRSKLKSFPKGLSALYERMLEQVLSSDHEDGEEDDADLRRSILATVSTTLRPLTMYELLPLLDIASESAEDEWQRCLTQIVATCGSFLAIREDTVIFIHHSAKDFLTENASARILTRGVQDQNYDIFVRSMGIMFNSLQRDIYQLGAPGISISQVDKPHPDPLANIAYPCNYWVDHLQACCIIDNQGDVILGSGDLEVFLSQKLLNWLESISLLRTIDHGVIALLKLERLAQVRILCFVRICDLID